MPGPTWTADQWLVFCEAALEQRLPMIEHYENYYAGEHRLAFATAKFREAFGDLFESFSTNWCGLVVDAAVERLHVQGFKFNGTDGDNEAWRMWQMNSLDAESLKAHTEAVKHGVAYAMVDPYVPRGAVPVITVEHPAQCIVIHEKGRPLNRLAALKRWREIDGTDRATLILPDRVHRYVSDVSRVDSSMTILGIHLPPLVSNGLIGGRWRLDESRENKLGVVSVVPLLNNPGMLNQDGVSDLRPAVALNDAANKFFTDMIVASEYAAYPQRILTGVEVPDDVNGNPDVSLVSSMSRTWLLQPGTDSSGSPIPITAQQFAAADLSNYVGAIDTAIQHIAAQTRTPPHYLLAKLINLSADALKAAETGLVHRVKRKTVDFSDSWEEVMRLAFRARGDDARATDMQAETMWANPERESAALLAAAAIQKRQVGVPFETIWAELGYSPQQIVEFKTLTGLPDKPPPGATTANSIVPGGQTASPTATPTTGFGKPTPDNARGGGNQ
jgi:hypothetical protein